MIVFELLINKAKLSPLEQKHTCTKSSH